MFCSTGQSLVVLDLFGPKVVFACSSIHMIVQQQLTLRLREEVHKIHEQSLLKSMAYVQCAPQKDPWVDSYLHNYNGKVLLQWKFDPSKSYECPWNTKLVCLWPFPLSSYQFKWQTTLRCYWSTARSNTKKIHLRHVFIIHSQADSSAHHWEFLCTNPPPPHILDIAIKWFSLGSRSL